MISSEAWSTIEDLVRTHRSAELKEVLLGLDDSQRKACVAPLKTLSRGQPGGPDPWEYFGGLAMVGAAVLPDARSVASWLRRFNAQDWDRSAYRREERSLHREVGDILIARDPVWLGRVVELWGERLRVEGEQPHEYRLLERLRSHADVPPPASQGYVAAWVMFDWLRDWRNGSGIDPVDRILADPRFAALVPIVPEIDGLAWWLSDMPQSLLRVLALPDVSRGDFLDALLARLQRGGRLGALQSWAKVWALLEPTSDELDARVTDLIAQLSGAQPVVAKLGQECLFQLHDEGRLSVSDLAEIGRVLLPRTEKNIVRATLARLRRHAIAHPQDRDPIIGAISSGLTSPAVDLQREAVKVLMGLAGPTDVSSEVRAEIMTVAGLLPPDLRPLLDELLGTDPRGIDGAARLPELRPPDLTAVEPITSPNELVEEFLLLVRGDGNGMGGVALERVTEAIPRLAGDASETGTRFRMLANEFIDDDRSRWIHHLPEWGDESVRRALFALLAAAVGRSLPRRTDRYNRDRPPQRAMVRRLFSVADAIAVDPRVRSVALPSWTNGVLTPTELLTRLTAAAAGAWEPDPIDLEQALLRLDLTGAVDPDPFAALGTRAGDTTSAWISGRSPLQPEVTLRRIKQYRDPQFDEGRHEPPPPDTFLSLPDITPADRPTDDLELWPLLTSITYPGRGFFGQWDPEAAYRAWPLVLPHHRELIAAFLIPDLVRGRSSTCQADVALVPLAEANGEAGPAMLGALTYALGAKAAHNRAAGVDALRILAARDQLDPSAFADVLVALLVGRDVNAKRLAPALAELANGGAARQVWHTMALVVSKFVADDAPTVTGLPDLISVAADVLLLVPEAAIGIPGLTRFAQRKGATRQLVEARRLHALLPPE